jgi:hypothetical protein
MPPFLFDQTQVGRKTINSRGIIKLSVSWTYFWEYYFFLLLFIMR